jgi:hypothetical protein
MRPGRGLSFLAATANICVQSSEGSLVDIARGELVEKELDAMIERRARKGETDRDENEELWQKSVRAYEEKRLQVARLEWHAFHSGQAERHRRTLQELISYHEMQAQRLLTEG